MYALIAVDDAEWASELASIINPLGYESTHSSNSFETTNLLRTQPIDLIICEPVLQQEDTIALFQSIPDVACFIIFLTDSPTELLYSQISTIKQTRFLVKPFHPFTLRSIIESLHPYQLPAVTSKGIKVRSGNGQRLLLTFDKILYVSADKNHCFIHTRQSRYILKQSLTRLCKELDSRFIQVHRGYWINIDCITRVNLARLQVTINELVIPVGRTYRDQLEVRLQDTPMGRV